MDMKETEALSIIEEMIAKTKEDIKDNSSYFLFWGWLVFISAAINYYLLVYTNYEFHSIPWIVFMPFGGIVSAYYGIKERKKEGRVRTYVDETFKHLGRAFGISMLVVCFCMPLGQQWKAFYPTIMVLYSIWLYFSGGMLKFKPLMWGAGLNWLLACVGYIYASTEIHLLLIAVAVLGGYIVPGYLLKIKFKKDVQRT